MERDSSLIGLRLSLEPGIWLQVGSQFMEIAARKKKHKKTHNQNKTLAQCKSQLIAYIRRRLNTVMIQGAALWEERCFQLSTF